MAANGLSGSPYSSETEEMRRDRATRSKGPGRASAMFSATDRASNSEKCWKTMPMPSARAAAGLGMATISSFQRSVPSVGCSAP